MHAEVEFGAGDRLLECLLVDEDQAVWRRELGDIAVAKVELGKTGGVFELVFCHPPHHGAARLFAGGRPLDGLPVADALAKEARDGCGVAREVGQDGFGVFHAGKVDDSGVGTGRRNCLGKSIPPEGIEVASAVDGEFRPHFEPIGRHAVEGAHASVESREDP